MRNIDAATLRATTLRTALITYRGELLSLSIKYPQQFGHCGTTIDEIDDVLLAIEGNINSVNITPSTCNAHR